MNPWQQERRRAVAAEMDRRKRLKYAHLNTSHFFVPLAVEILGVMGPDAGLFCQELGRCITAATSDPLSHQHLLQRVSVATQRGNAAAILGTMPECTCSIYYCADIVTFTVHQYYFILLMLLYT